MRNDLRKKKVYSGYYNSSDSKAHPIILIRGKYLVQYGFFIGDQLEITFSKNQIVITKHVKETFSAQNV